MSNTIKNLKSGNYEVVDNQGVSVTTHFIECLEKEFADLEAKLAESKRNNLILYSMLYQTLEKQGSENVASQIDQMTGCTYEKEADWFKGNKNYDQLKQQLADALKDFNDIQEENDKLAQQLAEKDQAIYGLQEINQSLGQTCNNDAKEIERLREQLAEKDAEIEKLETILTMQVIQVSEEQRLKLIRANCVQYNSNQKAIEQLEKVKEFLLEEIAEKQSCFDSGNYNDFADGVKTICELMLISIENQIKELGGGDV